MLYSSWVAALFWLMFCHVHVIKIERRSQIPIEVENGKRLKKILKDRIIKILILRLRY